MSKVSCFYCDKDEKLDSLMTHICELEGSELYLNKNQSYAGRVIIASKSHVKEFFELSDSERQKFSNDIATASKAVKKVFGADKINYAIFGDKVSHLHMHIVPKYENGRNWGEPYNDGEPVALSEEEYSKLVSSLRKEIK